MTLKTSGTFLLFFFFGGWGGLGWGVRESEPNSWEDIMTDELDRGKYPRMPWHDVHCALWGPACRDIARHFVQRWNHAKVILHYKCSLTVFSVWKSMSNTVTFFLSGIKLQMNKQFLF